MILDPKHNFLLDTDVLVGKEEREFNTYINSEGIIIYQDCLTNECHFFKLLKLPHQLSEQEKEEILTYRLGRYTKDMLVTIADIILHGKYIIPYRDYLNHIERVLQYESTELPENVKTLFQFNKWLKED